MIDHGSIIWDLFMILSFLIDLQFLDTFIAGLNSPNDLT